MRSEGRDTLPFIACTGQPFVRKWRTRMRHGYIIWDDLEWHCNNLATMIERVGNDFMQNQAGKFPQI